MNRRIALLAVDGLDWSLVHAIVDAGRMPNIARLLTAGASGPMAVPPPLARYAVWTTVATGALADRHHICCDWAVCADGLNLGAIGLEHLRVPSLWHRAAAAGLKVRVGSWPALLPQQAGAAVAHPLPSDGQFVTAGFESSVRARVDIWPLSPAATWPNTAQRAAVDALMHPAEVPEDAVNELLSCVQAAARPALLGAAREFIAAWSTVNHLGTGWATDDRVDLIALCFDGLDRFGSRLHAQVGQNLPDALRPALSWLDQIVGRYVELLGPDHYLVLVTDHGLPGGGYAPHRHPLPGGLLVVGPGVPVDHLLADASAVDVCPTVLRLLGLPSGMLDGIDGRALFEAEPPRFGSKLEPVEPCCRPARVAQDEAALAWLASQGIATLDLAALRDRALLADVEWTLGWADACLARGRPELALEHLRPVLAQHPGHLLVRLKTGEALLAAHRAAEAAMLLNETPESVLHGPWRSVCEAFVAAATGDVQRAETTWMVLLEAGAPGGLNPASRLGWLSLQRQRWNEARGWFERAVRASAEAVASWEGLAVAQAQLGEWAAAQQSFGRAIAHAPALARLHAGRANAFERAGRTNEADAAWQQAFGLDPTLGEVAAGFARTSRRALANEQRMHTAVQAAGVPPEATG